MAQCLTPFYRRDLPETPLPCGKCAECYKRRVSGWSFRLQKEGLHCSSSYFVTLTYNTDVVPITEKGFMSLKKSDVQKFFKRLRKTTKELRYYVCGEYGGKTLRPHYHAIIFNANIRDIEKAWSLQGNELGNIHVGEVSEASIGYTLKYMCKPPLIPMHKNDDRQKEFSLMSKGIGKQYLTDNMKKWHKNDLVNRMYCNLPEGKKITMPRYYKDKIYTQGERKTIGNFVKINELHNVDNLMNIELENPKKYINIVAEKQRKFNYKSKRQETL